MIKTNLNNELMEAVFAPLRMVFLLLMVVIITPSHATTLIATNLAKLSETAEQAFVVRIESFETSTTAEGRAFDAVTGTVTEPVFGPAKTSQTVSWKQFKFGRNVPMPAMPKYAVGSEYLIFLSGQGTGPGFRAPVGLGQGSFTVVRNPQTGAAMVRNAYMNSTLTTGLNVEAAAEDIAAQEVQKRALNPGQAKAEAAKLKAQLRSRGAGMSLEALKKTARFFHEQKQSGSKPSRDYKTTAPVRMLH